MTPSKITAWLDCPHYLTLRRRVDSGELAEPEQPFGSFARLLAGKGLDHEHECLAEHRRQGKLVLSVGPRCDGEPFAAWVQRVGNPLGDGVDVVSQMPFVHNGIRGIADFVERVEDPDTGVVSWEPVDAKLARSAAKPAHVLQLCFYADAIRALTGTQPQNMHIWLGSGQREMLRTPDQCANPGSQPSETTDQRLAAEEPVTPRLSQAKDVVDVIDTVRAGEFSGRAVVRIAGGF
jgi:uncharacterized protein